jgi:flagellar export protein FliJ
VAPFTFRLEQVRRYRKQLEEQAMQALAEALMRRDATQRRIQALEAELAAQREALSHPEAMPPGERWLASRYEDALRQDHEQALALLMEQDNEVDQRRAVLVERAKDLELLNKLRAKQRQRHLAREQQKEQQGYDETATIRHNVTV